MDVNETSKLTPAQLTLLFTLALPMVAVPALYIFIVAPELFDKYDTSKLLLLSFAMSAPVFGVTWGGTVLNDFLNKGRDSKELLKNTAEYITMASFVTVLIYGLFIMDVFWGAKGQADPRLVLILPVGLGTAGMLVVVSAHALRSSKKKPQKVET